MKHGPAPSRTLDLLNDILAERQSDDWAVILGAFLAVDRTLEYPQFSTDEAVDQEYLSDSDVEALDRTLDRFDDKDFGELRVLTHKTPAYDRAWKERGDSLASRMNFEDFFAEDSDAIKGVRDEMLEDSELREAFPVR